jgi:thioredoxin-related protein
MNMRLTASSMVVGMAIGLLAATASAEAKKGRSDIYDPNADPKADIAAALDRAQAEDKRVLIQYGANWCGWCHLLHEHFATVPEVKAILDESFIVVLVDIDAHPEIAKSYKTELNGVPFLSVLDAQGNKLTDQETGSLETGSRHDAAKMTAFLSKWAPEPSQSAEEALNSAIAEAKATDKSVFVHFGTKSCGWCRRLEQFIAMDGAAPLHDVYVFLKVEQDLQPDALAVRNRLAKGLNTGGNPWYAVVDSNGDVAATSNNAHGNTGYPINPEEIAHFVYVVDTTTDLDNATVASIDQALRARAKEIRP